MKMFVVRFLLILLSMTAFTLSATATPDRGTQVRLTGEVCYLLAASEQSAQELLRQQDAFTCSPDALNAPASELWMLIDLSDHQDRFTDPAIWLPMSHHGAITVTEVRGHQLTSRRYSPGELMDQAVAPNGMIFPLTEEASDTPERVLIRIERVWDLTNWRSVRLVSTEGALYRAVRDSAAFALLISLLVTPLILTALVYIALRINFLPYHFAMVACGLIYGLSWSGMTLLLPLSIEPVARSVTNHVSIALAFMFAALLTRALAGPEKIGPLWANALTVCGCTPVIVTSGLMLMAPGFSHYGSLVYHGVFLLPLLAILGALIHGSLRGLRICQVQLLAWSPMIIYVMMRVAKGVGLIDENVITQHGLLPSLITEALLTTGIIAFRIHQLRRRHEATLIRQATLQDLATQDPLTGALNRRAFLEQFHRRRAAAARSGKVLTLLLIDLDHFKSVNDRFGHTTGDDVLKAMTKLLQNHCRSDDLCARFGGEEFALLLQTSTIADADGCARRLRETIEDHRFAVAGQVTASIGVVTVTDLPNTPFESWYAVADKALYQAKENGRNRIQRSVGSPEQLIDENEAYALSWQVRP